MSERARAQCLMASSEYRTIKLVEEKVRFLRAHGFTYGVIASATGMHLSRVKRYLGNLATTSTRGRKPLLTPAQESELLDVVRKRALEHQPMTVPELQETVSLGTFSSREIAEVRSQAPMIHLLCAPYDRFA